MMRSIRPTPAKTGYLALFLLGSALAGCSTGSTPPATVIPSDERFNLPEGGAYKVGNPYQVEGIWYYPAEDYAYSQEGVASWYGPDFHGKRTANGEKYDMNALTAAHPTLPLPSIVTVTNLENGRAVKVRINDRGPFKSKRIIDVSRQAAQLLGFKEQGTARVRVTLDRDESLQIKNQLLASSTVDLPKVNAAPRLSISSESLSPPPGTPQPTSVASASPAPPSQAAVPQQAVSESAAKKPLASELGKPPQTVASASRLPPPATVQQPVPPPRVQPGKGKIDLPAGSGLYIQAGAFAEPSNAHRLEQQLREFGNVFIVTTTGANGRILYRVRLGPLQDDTGAEELLSQVKSYGYDDAQIVRF